VVKKCPECATSITRSYTINELNKIAFKNRGKFLLDDNANLDDIYKWQCEKGHIWEMNSKQIKLGKWCPSCNENKNNALIARKIASDRGGVCESDNINKRKKLDWRCSNGHTWQATLPTIIRGSWCIICTPRTQKRYTLEDMYKLAEERGGYCHSIEYKNLETLMEWSCKNDHYWKATYLSMKLRDSWCLICNPQGQKITIEYCQQLAKEKGGFCKST